VQDNASPMESETSLSRDRKGSQGAGWSMGRSRQLLTIALLALAFFLAPALQGINLVADQSSLAPQSTRAADKAASDEAQRLVSRGR
jgi:hypothetical protein